MQHPTQLFDRAAVLQKRSRVKNRADLFLQDDTADEIQERLTEVNRTFTDVAIVTPFPEIWADRFPYATIIADDDLLALPLGQFDLVIHAMALHWANDPVGQIIQCHRALKSDGLFIAALFGGQTLSELRAALSEAEIAVMGGLSPRIAPMGELRDLGALLQRGGLALPVADSAVKTVTYQSALHLMRDLRAMGETNTLSDRLRKPTNRKVFAKTNEIYHSAFGQTDGRIPATFEVVYLTGWAPDESQQKPMRPGSAAQRLADALGTDETKLSDFTIPRKDKS
ncbi:methyltransferase domain-containing protein [Cochlodiniinecator piscidefendens]|uniref:methyltransferase domain-containing protein n=1 Tax=Cochlodiniinecator piscidefendens TaxID=2715756 RepID=UPI00140C150E|nr:methyltransferase domain-containing protein [Cochlodiniinecator piscidefendens]